MTDLGSGRDHHFPPLLRSRPELSRSELEGALADCGVSDHYAPGYAQLRAIGLWALEADGPIFGETNEEADRILFALQHAISSGDVVVEAYGDDEARAALWGRDPDGPILQIAEALEAFIVEWVEVGVLGEASTLTAIVAAEWALWSLGFGPVSLFQPENPLGGAVANWAWCCTQDDRDQAEVHRSLRRAILGRMRKDGIAVDPEAIGDDGSAASSEVS